MSRLLKGVLAALIATIVGANSTIEPKNTTTPTHSSHEGSGTTAENIILGAAPCVFVLCVLGYIVCVKRNNTNAMFRQDRVPASMPLLRGNGQEPSVPSSV